GFSYAGNHHPAAACHQEFYRLGEDRSGRSGQLVFQGDDGIGFDLQSLLRQREDALSIKGGREVWRRIFAVYTHATSINELCKQKICQSSENSSLIGEKTVP